MELIMMAALDGPAPNKENNLPMIMKNGAPGGWPTSNLNEVVINSPQSQKLAVGSMVNRYVTAAIRKVIHPTILFSCLKLFIFGSF
jgi:hypothetical protein